MAKIYIGTSGFSYSHWGKGIFYPINLPQSDWFSYYAKHFDTVEINASFYRLPKKETFINWRKTTGPDFAFAIKGNRYITHVKKLKNCQEPVARFFEAAEGLVDTSEVEPGFSLENTSEVIIWQLPPQWKVNIERFGQFLKLLDSVPTSSASGGLRGSQWRYAFEFRHSTWLTVEVYALLQKHKAAVVFQDYPEWPITNEITTDFVYLRFHGRRALYSSCYTEKELREWADKIRKWEKGGLDVYVYFNNDALGYAIENAQKLKKLCLKKK